MQIGMIGLGRMGANMVRRLMRRGHAHYQDRLLTAMRHAFGGHAEPGRAS